MILPNSSAEGADLYAPSWPFCSQSPVESECNHLKLTFLKLRAALFALLGVLIRFAQEVFSLDRDIITEDVCMCFEVPGCARICTTCHGALFISRTQQEPTLWRAPQTFFPQGWSIGFPRRGLELPSCPLLTPSGWVLVESLLHVSRFIMGSLEVGRVLSLAVLALWLQSCAILQLWWVLYRALAAISLALRN